MDIVLEVADTFLFDYMYAWAVPAREAPLGYPDHFATNATQKLTSWQYKPATSWFSLEPHAAAYSSALTRDNLLRQFFSFFLIFWLFGLIMYYVFASLNYLFVFDKRTFNHPKYLKNQITLEMKQANWSMPIMAIFTAPLCVLEVNGYSKLYDTTAEGPGRWWDYAQFPAFVFFTDMCIYFIHRGLHHPAVYKYIHKPHHKWVVPTPYASHAFHPVDGYLQGLPYHLFPFIFPLQKMAYVAAFVFINFWTIMIHDGEYVANNPIINGAACHSIHHTAFNYNYGQFTTLWDRLGGSYRAPEPEVFQKEEKAIKKVWQAQSKTYQEMVAEVEGEDERIFNDTVETKKTL